jgi:hypothetical protein
MAVPSAPTNSRCTAQTPNSLTYSWGAPTDNGGLVVDGYAIAILAYDLVTIQRDNATPQQNSPLLSSATTSYTFSNLPANRLWVCSIQAHNSQGYSDVAPIGQAGGHPEIQVTRVATSFSYNPFETIGISEAGSPIPTLPADFGIVTRLNQGTEFQFGQLTSQVGRPDPDNASVSPGDVTSTMQPITRLALGGSDVPALATDTDKLAGEFSAGSLASAKGVVAHTTGAASFTLTRTWTSDRIATIYTMAVLNNLPISYALGGPLAQPTALIDRTLVWTYDVPTPLGVGIGDTFTTTVTITF